MKVIFLDIDGVLVTRRHLNHMHQNGLPMRDTFGHLFDPVCVTNLARIIAATDARIVISSIWRYSGISVMKDMWTQRHLPGVVVGITSRNLGTRGAEIRDWMQGIDIDSFVIIDDDSFDMLMGHASNFVHTTFDDGLMDHHVPIAIDILNNSTKE